MTFGCAETAAVARLAAWRRLRKTSAKTAISPVRPPSRPTSMAAAVLVARARVSSPDCPPPKHCFHAVDPALVFSPLVADGSAGGGTQLATISGRMRSILTAERTALNFLQRLSGVATQTWRYTSLRRRPAGEDLDTRKNDAGLARAGKVRVRCGGRTQSSPGLGVACSSRTTTSPRSARWGHGPPDHAQPKPSPRRCDGPRQMYGTRSRWNSRSIISRSSTSH